MEINNENQQQIEHKEIGLIDQNKNKVELEEIPNEKVSEENKILKNDSTELKLHHSELKNKSESENNVQIISNISDTETKETDKVILNDDNIIIQTHISSEKHQNLDLVNSTDHHEISANKLENLDMETGHKAENLETESGAYIENESTQNIETEKNWGDKTVKVIENITIVPSTEVLVEKNEFSEKINDIMEIEEYPEILNAENTACEQSSTDSSTDESSSKLDNNFLMEATVANYLKNSGLSFLQSQYGTDDSDDDSIVEISNQAPKDKEEYREKIVVNSSDSDDSDVEYLSAEQKQKAIDLVELIDDDDDEQPNKHKGPIRVKGEFLLDDLPPIQDLKITVPETECVELGKIHSIVDQLVLVDPIPGTVPLDLDTVLFMDKGKTVLGEVFDVLGQIKTPLYCIRFNSNKQIKEKGIEIGQTVFVAPRTEHTQFIILDNLMRIRGSDASWENDIEPSDKHRDFSDDEEETNYRKNLRNKDRPLDHNDLTKRSRTVSTSSSMYSTGGGSSNSDLDENIESRLHNNQHSNNYGNNRRGGGYQPGNNRRGGGYQPRQQFQRDGGGRGRQNQYQNVPRFNYDNNSGGSWHANYNSNNNSDYYQHQHQHNSYQQQSQAQPQYQSQQLPHSQQQQQSPIVAQSNLYPNPYAVRPPYIPPNLMQQPLFPPPSQSQIVQQPPPNYQPQ